MNHHKTVMPKASRNSTFIIHHSELNSFLQNKPNFKTIKNDVSPFLLMTKDCRLKTGVAKNKPNSNPISKALLLQRGQFPKEGGDLHEKQAFRNRKNMQNEPNFKNLKNAISAYIKRACSKIGRAINWLRFQKRTQFLVDVPTPKPPTAKRHWRFHSCAFEALRFKKRTQFLSVGWAVPTRKIKNDMPKASINSTFTCRDSASAWRVIHHSKLNIVSNFEFIRSSAVNLLLAC